MYFTHNKQIQFIKTTFKMYVYMQTIFYSDQETPKETKHKQPNITTLT